MIKIRELLKIDGYIFSDELSESEVRDLFFTFIQEKNLYYVGLVDRTDYIEFPKEGDYEPDSSDI